MAFTVNGNKIDGRYGLSFVSLHRKTDLAALRKAPDGLKADVDLNRDLVRRLNEIAELEPDQQRIDRYRALHTDMTAYVGRPGLPIRFHAAFRPTLKQIIGAKDVADASAVVDRAIVDIIGANPDAPEFSLPDLVWVFFYERFGIFRTLGATLDQFFTGGRYRITASNEVADGVKVRQCLQEDAEAILTGLASRRTDRDSAYRRALGWTTTPVSDSEVAVNTGFARAFRQFFNIAHRYYNQRTVQTAITGGAAPQFGNAASLSDVALAAKAMSEAARSFDAGAVGQHTQTAVMTVYESMLASWYTRDELGIVTPFLDETLAAAHSLLVREEPSPNITTTDLTLHKTCAEEGRRIVSEVLGRNEPFDETWMREMETPIEAFRTAYRELYNVDLGTATRLPNEAGGEAPSEAPRARAKFA